MQKVIVIEDQPVDFFIIQKIMELTNFCNSPMHFSNASQALQYLQKVSNENNSDFPEIILLDLNMPIMNGFAFLEEFNRLPKKLLSKTKILIVSSSNNQNDRSRVERYPFVKGYIIKPFTEKHLGLLK